MDCVHLIFILLSMLWPLGSLSKAGLTLYAASYGTLIAIFEFLTGGIPMALALMPLLLALGHRGDKADYAIRLVMLWTSFCIAVTSAFALKKLYVIALLGDTENFISTLLHRVYGDLGEKPGAQYSPAFFAYTYYRASFVLGLGSSKFATLLFAGSLATIALLVRRRLHTSPNLRLACAASFVGLILWYAAFLNHALCMVRPMVVILVAAAILLLASSLRYRETSME